MTAARNKPTTNKRQKVMTITVILLFVLAVTTNIIKARYGIAWEDEYLYTLGGYRLWQGDALMFNELNEVMFMDIFTYPLVSLYMSVFKTSDGIIYFMRLAYVLFTTIIAIVFYLRYRRKGFGVLLASLFYMLTSVFNTMALSYNTMALGFLILSVCSLPDKDNIRFSRFFVFGIFYSCATLNYPLLAIGYLAVFIFLIINRKDNYYKNMLLGSIAGVALCVFLFCLFVFSRSSLNQIMKAFPLIFASGQNTIFRAFLANGYHGLITFGFTSILMLLHFLYIVIKKPKSLNKELHFILSSFIAVVSTSYMVIHNANDLNYALSLGITISITYIGIVYLLFEYDKDCLLMFVFAGLYFIATVFSSDAGVNTFSNPLILSSMATIILIAINSFKLKYILLPLILCYVMIFKLFYVYGGKIYNLNQEVSVGPSKYLYTNFDKLNDYEHMWNSFEHSKNEYDIEDLTIIGNKNYLYFSNGIRIIDRFAFFNTRNTKKDHLNDLHNYYKLTQINNNYVLIVSDNQLNIDAADFPNSTTIEINNLYTLIKR